MKEIRKYRVDAMNLLFVGIITVVLSFPLFLLLYRYMPSLVIPVGEGGFRIDHILLFLVLFFILFFVIKRFQVIFIGFSIFALLGVTILNFSGIYTLENLYTDYNKILYDLGDDSLEKRFFMRNESFSKEEELRAAINFNDPSVVQFARNMATTNFEEYKGLISDTRVLQYFSIFKEIKSRWIYVYDPRGEDFYSTASENIKSLEHNNRFKGDCDDYSIMIAACIRAIGGEVRLVRTRVTQRNGTSIGHMYPEVKVGDKKELENIAHVIKTVLFPNEAGNSPIRYFQDSKGNVWLNFDYNDDFPGGRYQSDERISQMEI